MQDTQSEKYFNVSYTVSDITWSDGVQYYILKIKNVSIEAPLPDESIDLNNLYLKGDFDNVNRLDSFNSVCYWSFNKKYGWQLSAKSSIVTVPSNIKGIKRFLEHFIDGVGPSVAQTIVDAYGVESISKIKEDISNLTCLPRIGKKKAERIFLEVHKHLDIEELSLSLFQMGITNYIDIVNIYKTIPEDASSKIMANPYIICDELSLSKFNISDTIAKKLTYEFNNSQRVSHAILLFLEYRANSFGDLFVSVPFLNSNLSRFISNYSAFPSDNFSEDDISGGLNLLRTLNKITLDTSIDSVGLVYLSYFYHMETFSANVLRCMLNGKNELPEASESLVRHFIVQHEKKIGFSMAKSQKQAIYYANNYKFSILTGGPGTGKTQTIDAIINYFESLDRDLVISLAAPTGRAAKRMSEISNREAVTVHRLLDLGVDDNPNSVSDVEPLDIDVLIIDEFSMVDMPLFAKILKSIEKSRTRVIISGDYNQLPSVGPGLILRDLIQSKRIPTTILSELFRQDKESQIALNSQKILKGITTQGENHLTFDIDKQDFFFFKANDLNGIKALIVKSIHSLINLKKFTLNDIMVLSPTRKGPLGIECLNKLLQSEFNPSSETKNQIDLGETIFREGDKVMQIKNNYEKSVFNGETGVVAHINKDECYLTVSYSDNSYEDNAEVKYEFSELREINLAYTMTIHKSQGCECGCVILPISAIFKNLSRNVLYTAITRAKGMDVLIGEMSALDKSINTVTNVKRNTCLKERLELSLFPIREREV